MYEVQRVSLIKRFSRDFMLFILSLIASGGYFYLYTHYLNLDSPKVYKLAQDQEGLHSKLNLLNRQFQEYNAVLTELQMRDENVYRPVFGMENISTDVRNAGYGGVDRYSYLDEMGSPTFLVDMAKKMDVLYKKAAVQSKSYDEVAVLAKRAGDMAQNVPSIPPVALSTTRQSSGYGYRTDPFTKIPKMHTGLDFVGNRGEPIYATGNGTVVEVTYNMVGYGREIVIDHGFGYKTRYAHLDASYVNLGDTVKRGDHIGAMGSTGRSTGVHLHYEVMYRDAKINPANHFNKEIAESELKLIQTLRDTSGKNNG